MTSAHELAAGLSEHLEPANVVQGEAELAGGTNEGQGRTMLGLVAAVAADRAAWRRYQPDPLVVAHRLEIDAGGGGEAAKEA